MSSLTRQVGGDHYTGMKYQPVAFASKMHYNFIQGSILKYVSRYPLKNGVEDLAKAMHFCELGVATKPVNFALPTDEDAQKYVKKNGFDKEMEELISDITNQFWIGIADKILKIKERVYGTKK